MYMYKSIHMFRLMINDCSSLNRSSIFVPFYSNNNKMVGGTGIGEATQNSSDVV